jgi:hypothetical protein
MRTITTICAYEDDTNQIIALLSDDDGFVAICANVYLELEDVDYGVPGSPVWKEVSSYDVEYIYIDDDGYTLEQFKAKYNDVVVQEVLRLIDDAVDELDLY